MKTIVNESGTETIIFAETCEPEAYEQIVTLANHKAYRKSKIRIMPDTHAGKGCTIGTTMVIADKITPNLVGVDIGCGMLTVGLKGQYFDFEKIDQAIKKNIPCGFSIHENQKRDFDLTNLICKDHVNLRHALLSIGSLGGGNHFIEIGKAKNSDLFFLTIHSGSRKLGLDVCKFYQKKAIDSIDLNARHTTNKDLAFLTGKDFEDYLHDMDIVQKYASVNREVIAEIILKEACLQATGRFETIHNYIDLNRMVLRKGAVSAEKGEILLIPINMRDGSLLCTGKGNENWNYSAPHGAGRLMSRNKAKNSINMDDFIESMQGIYTTSVVAETLDEAPQAYKSIDEIRSTITDTVDVFDVIKPLYNFKAHQ